MYPQFISKCVKKYGQNSCEALLPADRKKMVQLRKVDGDKSDDPAMSSNVNASRSQHVYRMRVPHPTPLDPASLEASSVIYDIMSIQPAKILKQTSHLVPGELVPQDRSSTNPC